MKSFLLLLGFLFCINIPGHAQDKFKFGNVSLDELKMTHYEKDTLASAVVLYEECQVYYNIQQNDFVIETEYVVRIKILTSEGTSYASATIPFYEGNSRDMSEVVSGLTGYTYNLENNEIQKEKLAKNYIFTEDITEHQKRLKFAMPAVKAGSVIEYRYKLTSPYYYSLEDYKFQRDIPVQYSHFRIQIPEYFVFNREMKGYEPIKVEINNTNQSFMFGTNNLTCSAEVISAEVRDLPALKDESNVWNYNDFMAGITFEIKEVRIHGVYYKSFSKTWSNVIEELNNNTSFGKAMNYKNLFKEELAPVLNTEASDKEKIRSILDIVRNKVKWNEKMTLLAGNPKKALKDGIGSSGEINALLICALKDAGFNAYPVAMSLRSRGRIPLTYASIANLNYFIVGVAAQNQQYYLDATLPYTDINVIPTNCMVDKALAIFPQQYSWVDLTNIEKNKNVSNIYMSFNEEGSLSGKIMKIYSGESSYLFQQAYRKAKDQNEYIEQEASEKGIRLSEYKMAENRKTIFSSSEIYTFTKDDIRLEEHEIISFNPLLFTAMATNPFKAETRKLPVEFPFPYETRVNIEITIPEGYVVDEMPQPVKYVYEDDLANFTYMSVKKENTVQIISQFNLNTCIVPATNYEILRDFWSKVFAKTHEFITLKKVNIN